MALRRRSVALDSDPKAKELSQFLGSRDHQGRLVRAASIGPSPAPASLSVEWGVNVLRESNNTTDDVVSSMLPRDVDARLEWRETLDKIIRRLRQDWELPMLDQNLQEKAVHEMRCRCLERTFQWYERHAQKEAGKERPGPAFLRFDPGTDAPVMPGSLRTPRAPRSVPSRCRRTSAMILRTVAGENLLESSHCAALPRAPMSPPGPPTSPTPRSTALRHAGGAATAARSVVPRSSTATPAAGADFSGATPRLGPALASTNGRPHSRSTAGGGVTTLARSVRHLWVV